MKSSRWLRLLVLLGSALITVCLAFVPRAVSATVAQPADDLELVREYAPALFFHPGELFRPQPVEVMVSMARLRQSRRIWFEANVLSRVSTGDLLTYRQSEFYLDAWYGDAGSSDYKNYSAHRAYYDEFLSPESGGLPIVAYAHVARLGEPGQTVIQYWLFYYYNDWFNKHEGDWEMAQVVLGPNNEPEWLVLSQHHGGTRRPWSAVEKVDESHAAVFVALGSHANYFVGDEIYPNGRTIGSVTVEIMDRTGRVGPYIPEIVLVPESEEIEIDPPSWPGLEWMLFGGRWGEQGVQGDFSGPLGPASKGEQWNEPHAWGMAQPLDAEVWYRNRLRVEVVGDAAQSARIRLQNSEGDLLAASESLGAAALLHRDPDPDEEIIAGIEVSPGLGYGVHVAWPDRSLSQVQHYEFGQLSPPVADSAEVSLKAGEAPTLRLAGSSSAMLATVSKTEQVTWDAPDIVWVAGILPVPDVVRGVTISLLAGILPALFYVGVLYWADRYEKEPKRLVAAAFIWGSVPAILVAVAVQVFFDLPPDLIGPEAIEAVRAGLLAPVVEELLKALVVVFIAYRYRLEFDNVLDGIIYGAVAGLGFAMTGNTLSYVGAFLLRGYAGLSSSIFVGGVLYGLNHAMYSAVFGAGLGYARLAQKRWQRRLIPPLAFAAAVVSHSVHNLAVRNAGDLNVFTAVSTWAGMLVIVAVIIWSLGRQRRSLEAELPGEIPQEYYQGLMEPWGRGKNRWAALRQEGPRGWLRERRKEQLCAELAFKKMQLRLHPEEPGLLEEANRLRGELQSLVEGEPPGETVP